MNPVSGIAAGQIALTRMPNGAASTATARVSWMHPALGGAVDRSAPPHEAGHRAGVEDDAAVPLLLELQHGVLAAEEHATEVDRDQPVEVLECVVLERHAQPRRGNSDVVEQDVEPAVMVDRGRDHGLHLLLV